MTSHAVPEHSLSEHSLSEHSLSEHWLSEHWLSGVRQRSAALLLEGPAGIGKTHAFAAAVVAARADGFRVLRAQPAQAEARLVGSALLDLCEDVTDDEIAELPEVQAGALSVALLRAAPDGTPIAPQAVTLAVQSLVRRWLATSPVLVAVDDLQWLDPETATVLASIARRAQPAGLGLLLARRTEPTVPTPEVIADLAAALPMVTVVVPPLGTAELERLVRERVGEDVSPGMLRRALASAQGNPLFAVEVARVLRRHDGIPGLEPTYPDSLTELVGRHVEALPARSRLGLAAAAALRRPTLRSLRRLGLADSLAPAELAGLISVRGHDVHFRHPLYAAAAYDGLAGSQRMSLHARLAGVVDGEEERARHLALGADEPDESVACALDEACERALRRGAVHAAIDASRLGLLATPPGSAAAPDRRTRLGRLLYRAGEVDRARDELAAAAHEHGATALQRARALHELARVVNDTESQQRAAALEREALTLVAGDPDQDADLLVDIHLGLSCSVVDDWPAAVGQAEIAVERLAAGPPDPFRSGAALSALVASRWHAGRGADLELCRRAVELEGDAVALPVADRAVSVLSALLVWTDDFPAARAQLELTTRLAVEEGDEASRGYLLALRAEVELLAGDWAVAEGCTQEWRRVCERSHIPAFARMARQYAAWLRALRGDLAGAVRDLLPDLPADAASAGENPHLTRRAHGLLGFCAGAAGDVEGAVRHLERYTALYATTASSDPALQVFAADHIEALVSAGRLDDGEAALGRLVGPARQLGRTAVLAAAARCDALLAASRGDAPRAVAAAETSLLLYDQVERRFDRARAQLTKGQVHRRFKQKSLARAELTAARDAFAALGAAGFADRAQAELNRVGLRPPASLDLTETERQIAELAATGRTSAEMAASLFLSTKTVSANLTRIYRKLGVRNRSELTARLAPPG